MANRVIRALRSRVTVLLALLASAACGIKAAYEIDHVDSKTMDLLCRGGHIRADGQFVGRCDPVEKAYPIVWIVAMVLFLVLAIVLWRVQARRGKRMARDGGSSAVVQHGASG